MHKYIVHNNEVYEWYSDDLMQGYRKCVPEVPKITPYLSFAGPRIRLEDWRKILAFFKWAFDTTKSEVQVRLYFNKADGVWKPWAFPQEKGTGMSTREIGDKEGDERKKAEIGKGWIEGGTVHSHCASAAYQSPVDKDNEKNKNGIHLTVGKLDESVYDIHSRMSFRGIFYDVCLTDWFELPKGLEALPPKFENDVMKYFLTLPVTDEDTFPDEWKENVIEVKRERSAQYSEHYYQPNYNQGSLPYDRWIDDGAPETKEGVITTGRRLTKKEKKILRKEIRKMIRSGNDPEKVSQDSHTQAVHRASIQTVQLCAVMGMDASRLFMLNDLPPNMIKDAEMEAVSALEDIVKKEGVTINDVEEWLIKSELTA